jgi:hypothetical protein
MIISQPGNLFKIMSAEQQNTINNIVSHMSGIEGPKRTKYIGKGSARKTQDTDNFLLSPT